MEKRYKVIGMVEFTVRAESSEKAIEQAVDAAGLATGNADIRSVLINKATYGATEIVHDPAEVDAMQRWLEQPR